MKRLRFFNYFSLGIYLARHLTIVNMKLARSIYHYL